MTLTGKQIPLQQSSGQPGYRWPSLPPGLHRTVMHTVEKSAEILVKMLSMRPDKLQTISPQNFRDLAKDFKVTLPDKFLYEK